MTTSVSSYRSGSPRFGTKDTGPINSEVKTYQLSPDELEKYRNGADNKMAGKGNLEEAKRLLTETDLSIKEIEKLKAARDLNIENIKELNIKYKTVIEENEQLKSNVIKLIGIHDELLKDRNELDTELKRVEKELESKNDELISLAAEFKSLQELNCEAVNDEPVQEVPEIKFLRDSNNHLHQENLELRIRARVYKEAMSELLKDKS